MLYGGGLKLYKRGREESSANYASVISNIVAVRFFSKFREGKAIDKPSHYNWITVIFKKMPAKLPHLCKTSVRYLRFYLTSDQNRSSVPISVSYWVFIYIFGLHIFLTRIKEITNKYKLTVFLNFFSTFRPGKKIGL